MQWAKKLVLVLATSMPVTNSGEKVVLKKVSYIYYPV